MTKRVFLLVSGDGDFDALNFERNFNKQEVYEDMLKDGMTRKTLTIEEEWGTDNIYVSIREFEAVDSEFISFMWEEFLDYDYLKAKNFYEVEAGANRTKAIGTATVKFCVEIDAEDISTDSMSIAESDELIAEAIFSKYGLHVNLNRDITVEKVVRGNES